MTLGEPLIVRLPQLRLWMDGQRYDVLPRVFAAADLERSYTKHELCTQVFGLTPRANGRFHRQQLTQNLGTCSLGKDGSVTLEGICLIHFGPDDHLTFTPAARELAALYARNPEGDAWRVALAELLLRFEVRLRTLVRYLTRPETYIAFAGGDSRFLGVGSTGVSRLTLYTPRRSWQVLKESDGELEPRAFTLAMLEDPDGNVGPLWRTRLAELGVDTNRPLALRGLRGQYPSNNDLGTRIRSQLLLLGDLRLFQPHREGWQLNTQRFRELFSPALQADFLQLSEEDYVYHLLMQAYREGARPDGMIMAADLAARLADMLDDPPDDPDAFLSRWVARFEYQGRFRLADHYRGLPGDGPGLNGNVSYQHIKFSWAGG